MAWRSPLWSTQVSRRSDHLDFVENRVHLDNILAAFLLYMATNRKTQKSQAIPRDDSRYRTSQAAPGIFIERCLIRRHSSGWMLQPCRQRPLMKQTSYQAECRDNKYTVGGTNNGHSYVSEAPLRPGNSQRSRPIFPMPRGPRAVLMNTAILSGRPCR